MNHDRPENRKDPGQDQAGDRPGRETARAVLERDIKHAQRVCQEAGLEAIQMQALARCLPADMAQLSPDADQALYDLLMLAHRRKGLV
jgi:hypothetical protein